MSKAICIISLTIWLCGTFHQACIAELASVDQMTLVCQNWLMQAADKPGAWNCDPRPVIASTHDFIWRDTLLARCFNISPTGYVVVPALMELPPITVYYERGRYIPGSDGGLPQLTEEVLVSAFRLFARKYGGLDSVQPTTGDVLFERTHRELWDRLLAAETLLPPDQPFDGRQTRDQVGPLVSSEWRQGSPYNLFCPIGHAGEQCLVGCAAVAAAMVMDFHRWPPVGSFGGFCFDVWDGDQSCGGSTPGELLTVFVGDSYAWGDMRPHVYENSPEEVKRAVGELCYEVAVAFDTDFGVCASGVYPPDIRSALEDDFRYQDCIDFIGRYGWPNEFWFAFIQNEINADRPVIYNMSTISGGAHAFVVDGWLVDGGERKIHINYGWGSGAWQNGWWALDNIPGSAGPTHEQMFRYIMPREDDVIAVAPDGSGDYPTIQAAMNSIPAACHTKIIELGYGTFSGEGNRDILFDKMTAVYSRFSWPSICIIECGGTETDPHRGFQIEIAGTNVVPVIGGVTVRGGFVSDPEQGSAILCDDRLCWFDNCWFIENAGGAALSVRNGGAGHLEDCRFIGNSSSGLACISAEAATLQRCFFGENSAENGAGAFIHECSPTFNECTFESNISSSDGGGVYCLGQFGHIDWTPKFNDCLFLTNVAAGKGGGAVSDMCKPEFVNCTFQENEAERGGGAHCYVNAAASYFKCAFVGNHATWGGGALGIDEETGTRFYPSLEYSTFIENNAALGGAVICLNEVSPEFTNCTFSGNSANDGGSVYCVNLASPSFANCIIAYGTGGAAIVCNDASGVCNPTLSCCDIWGNVGGNWVGCIAEQYGLDGNISQWPCFCQAGTTIEDRFSLHSNSPCAPFSAPNYECDLIGAWPVGCGWSGSVTDKSVVWCGSATSCPNPFSTTTKIAFRIPEDLGGSDIRLSILDASGRLVRTLLDASCHSGAYEISWQGRDDRGAAVAAGVYFYQIQVGEESATRRVVVIR
ncbi:MAG: C10 family peptidase [Candidatus Eisenbacteria sp.]|nr:C10 family peptidase [Candidatus Eisenbacteria bacterium]